MKFSMRLTCLILALIMAVGLCACAEPSVGETPNNGAENPGGDDTNTELPPEGGENNGENQEPDEGGEGGIPDPDPTPVTYQFSAENIKSAKIVYVPGDYATGGVIDTAIDNLISTINTRFACKIIKTNDQTIASSDTLKEYEYEIVIGNTKRDASKNNLTDLLYSDWGYVIDGTKIVIKGGSQEALATAINKFRTAITAVKDKTLFYTQEMDHIYRANFAGKDLLINGTPISEFSIVYPAKGTAFEKELARRLSDYITSISGHVIPFYSNVQKKPAAHEIMIGVPADRSFTVLTKQGAAVEADKNHVAIVGETAYDYGLAQQELSSLLYAAAMGTKTLSLPDKTAVNGETEKIKIMAYNVLGANYYYSRCDNIRRLVTKYLPDIVGYQEPDVTMTNKIRMDGYYEWFDGKPRHTRPDGTVIIGGANSISPIGYAKDRFKFILGDTKWCTGTPDVASKLPNSDYYRMFTYAMLRDKQTGEEFIVVNWHLQGTVAVSQLTYMFKFFQANYTDIPVIMLGDFNASSESMVVSGTVKKFGGFASLHEMASNKEASNPADIDWIFAMGCCVNGTYYKQCLETYPDKQASVGKAYGDGKMPSDHPAVYAELTIRADRAEHTHDWSHNASQVEWQTQPTVPERQK